MYIQTKTDDIETWGKFKGVGEKDYRYNGGIIISWRVINLSKGKKTKMNGEKKTGLDGSAHIILKIGLRYH